MSKQIRTYAAKVFAAFAVMMFADMGSVSGALWAEQEAPATTEADLLAQITAPRAIETVTISAQGQFFAAIRNDFGTRQLEIWPVGQVSKTSSLPIETSRLGWMAWVGGNQLVFYLRPTAASVNANAQSGMMVYDAKARTIRPLIARDRPSPNQLPPVLLAPLVDDANAILLQWEDTQVPGYPAVYRVDPKTGDAKKLISAWKPIVRWYASPEGDIALGEGFDGRKRLLYHQGKTGGWRRFQKADVFSDPSIVPVSVEPGGKTAVMLASRNGDKRALWRVKLTDGDYLRRLGGDERFDAGGAIADPVNDLVVGFSVLTDRLESRIWRADISSYASQVAAALGVWRAHLVGGSRDGKHFIFKVENEDGPGGFAHLDLGDNGSAPDPIISWIGNPPAVLAKIADRRMVWIDLPDSKGRMHATLTTPLSGGTGRALVKIHGGPVSRVSARYDSLVYWLVKQGYSVLEPNFRGSSGYGDRWRRAGMAKWGTDMQRDIRTAGKWLIDQGHVQHGQLCAIGGSYGGYSAVMSVIKDYNIFQCAASLNGVMNLPQYVGSLKGSRFQDLSLPRIKGNLGNQSLRARSPLFRANLVRRPVLLYYGTNDTNIDPSHSVNMATALTRLGREHQVRAIKGAGHSLRKPLEKITYYRGLTDFLDTYITRH